MRSSSSPAQQSKALGAVTTLATEVVSPCITTCASQPRLPTSPASTRLASTSTPLTFDAFTPDKSATTEEQEAENAHLKKRIEDLSFQLECVIDHTIKNDARLLQYTSEIFSTSTSESNRPDTGNIETSRKTPAILTDCSVQCDPVSIHYERSAEDEELIASLRTTIQVLEAEVECLRSECKLCTCRNSGPWTICVKKRSLTTDFQNKLLTLDLANSETTQTKSNGPVKEESEQKKNKRKKKKRKMHDATVPWKNNKNKSDAPHRVEPKSIEQVANEITFSSMLIVGDSHARHLADMVQDRICRGTKVTGVCKPGAGLLDVASSGPSSSDDFTVLIAGTNDIANGQQSNIFRHLERVVQDRMGVSRVVLSTIPHRHDLPAWHPVHRHTHNVNRYIEEIAARHVGVKILNFNQIPRRLFTRHGMHLRMPGKRLLARHLLQCLYQFADDGMTSPPLLDAAITRPMTATDEFCGSPARMPFMLQHDSYAEAVKSPQSAQSSGEGLMDMAPLPSQCESPAAQLSSSMSSAWPPIPPLHPLPSRRAPPSPPPAPQIPAPTLRVTLDQNPSTIAHIPQPFLVGTPPQVPIKI